MRLHRFIVSFKVTEGEISIEKPETVHQLQKVLRLKTGDEIILSDGIGNEARSTILSLDKNVAVFKIIESYRNENEPRYNVFLYASIIKRDNFEVLSQKAVECGVKNITPLITERTIKTKLQEERLEKIILEASEQSFRAIVPKLNKTLSLEEALKDAREKSLQIFICDTTYKENTIPEENKDRAVFIGPEGGFTEKELQIAESFGAKKLSLGKSILRAETAGIVAVYKLAN